MIASFFKQSKPIVHVLLVVILSAYFIVEIFKSEIIQASELNILLITALKYIFLLIYYLFFNYVVSYFEIEKYHAYAALVFVLLSSILMTDIFNTFIIFGFVILSIGIWRLLNILKSKNPISCIFDATFLILLASLFYQPFVYLLLLILVASLVFLPPKLFYFISPVLSISAFVIIVQMYNIFRFDEHVGFDFFLPDFNLNIYFYYDKLYDGMLLIWMTLSLLCVYQIIQVRRKRALYHKEVATFFLFFLSISFLVFMFTEISIGELWMLSLWPLSIYLGDFLSRIVSKLKLELFFWAFMVLSISFLIW